MCRTSGTVDCHAKVLLFSAFAVQHGCREDYPSVRSRVHAGAVRIRSEKVRTGIVCFVTVAKAWRRLRVEVLSGMRKYVAVWRESLRAEIRPDRDATLSRCIGNSP
jgi:hypothetical protein